MEFFVRIQRGQRGLLHKGQQTQVYFSVCIFQIVGLHLSGKGSGNVDLLVFQQLAAELQTLCGIVVAADEKYRYLPHRQCCEELVQHGDSFCNGYVFIVNIPRHQNRLHRLFFSNVHHLLQQFFLLGQERIVVHSPPQMQIAKM